MSRTLSARPRSLELAAEAAECVQRATAARGGRAARLDAARARADRSARHADRRADHPGREADRHRPAGAGRGAEGAALDHRADAGLAGAGGRDRHSAGTHDDLRLHRAVDDRLLDCSATYLFIS